jgi:hypothetical protein
MAASDSDGTLTDRLLAALLVRDRPLEDAVRLLHRLGMTVSDISLVLAGSGGTEGASQREVVAKLGDLGFDVNAIVAMTGFSKASVGPVLSRHKKARAEATSTIGTMPDAEGVQ